MITRFEVFEGLKKDKEIIDMKKVYKRFYPSRLDFVSDYMAKRLFGKYATYYCDNCEEEHSGIVKFIDFDVIPANTYDEPPEKPELNNVIVFEDDRDAEAVLECQVSYEHPIIIDYKKAIEKRFDL